VSVGTGGGGMNMPQPAAGSNMAAWHSHRPVAVSVACAGLRSTVFND
jgi:hypothetical protein